MTSLCPGTLFQTSGLNQNSTPTPPTATPSEIDRKLVRQSFNGRDWPRESPVARVYDVSNSSTSLVLLNRRRKKKSQLRGETVRNGEILTPEPRRHLPEESTVNWQHHKKCLHSSTEPFRPRVKLDLGWVNMTQRPPVRFGNGSHVDPRRHTSCRVSADNPVVGWSGIARRPMTSPSQGADGEMQNMSPMLNDPDISQGGRRYLYSIARIYSTSQMKQLKQDQYHQLLFKELNKGYHSPKEYERYLSYLNTPRKTQFGKLDNYDDVRRSKSVPPPAHTDMSGRGDDSDRGGSRGQKRAPYMSRSWAPSLNSSQSRPSTRQRGGKKKRVSKQQQESPPLSPSPTDDSHRHSLEPTTLTSEEDASDHTRKEESEAGDEALTGIQESEEASNRSKDKATTKSDTAKDTESTLTPLSVATTKEEDGTSPRKDNNGTTPRKDVLSPRKGEETPRKADEVDGPGSSVKDERSSEGAATSTTVPPSATTTTTTSNNFLALIVSDVEKDEDSRAGEDSEQEKSSSAGDADASKPPMARKFSDINMATGHTPRVNKEGRTRPLSRAGRGNEEGKEKENSDDDYDDTDEETEKTEVTKDKQETIPPPQQQPQEPPQKEKEENGGEAVQRSALESEAPAIDTSRTDDSKTEERGEMQEESRTVVDPDKRAGSPEQGRDERAHDSQESNGQRSLIIPVSQRSAATADTKENELDLSAESKNRDVDKLEY